MPIHLNDLDVVSEVTGLDSALIVSCNMCPAVTVAVRVLGCESATETVRDAVKSDDCKLIEGMEFTGIMNAQVRFQLPGNVSFHNCKIVPISHQKKE